MIEPAPRLHSFRLMILGVLLVAEGAVAASPAQPWLDATRTPESRALLVLKAMTLEEKLALLHGPMALPLAGVPIEQSPLPPGAPWSAGFVPGVPRLALPPLVETDASLGVTNPLGIRTGDVATAMPASLALAATFSPEMAYQSGATVGSEAHSKGFNVLLGGGMNLTRDPRAGRNFEYFGEDPLLAGVMAGEAIRGTQDQHVISTTKHFALNANETNRNTLDARIDPAALRESDLLAFQIAIERGHPGSVMCAYNKINGDYACANPWLLNSVLKKDWGYPGWVMSDWGAVHSELDALQGLDQESGEQLDSRVFFAQPLAQAVAAHRIPQTRIDDMVYRILRAEFSSGLIDDPPATRPIDYAAHASIALNVAQAGVVVLKNAAMTLPLTADIKRIAVIGGQAQVGVLSGGGSSQVTPSHGAFRVPIGGNGGMAHYRDALYFAPSPVLTLRKALPEAAVRYDSGAFPEDAAALAAKSDVALVFVTRHEMEGYDVPNLRLPHGQDALVTAVAAANPHTIVVLETGNPTEMPWLPKVAGLLAAWYPGQEGAQAITDILTGKVNPSGRLPISFPESESQLPRSKLPNFGVDEGVAVSVDYTEGADVGYRWYARRGIQPLFSFGFGLSYTTFAYEHFKVEGTDTLMISFDVINTGTRAGADVPQVYLTATPTGSDLRLIGFSRVELKAGERRRIRLSVDRRLLAHYDEARHLWRLPAGTYAVQLGTSATQLATRQSATLKSATFADE
jgi:beta-glucosidase